MHDPRRKEWKEVQRKTARNIHTFLNWVTKKSKENTLPHFILSTARLPEVCDRGKLRSDWLAIKPAIVEGLDSFLSIFLKSELKWRQKIIYLKKSITYRVSQNREFIKWEWSSKQNKTKWRVSSALFLSRIIITWKYVTIKSKDSDVGVIAFEIMAKTVFKTSNFWYCLWHWQILHLLFNQESNFDGVCIITSCTW